MQKISLILLLLVVGLLAALSFRLYSESNTSSAKAKAIYNQNEQLQDQLDRAKKSLQDLQQVVDAGLLDQLDGSRR